MVDRVTRDLDPEQVENDSNQKMEEFESSNDDSKMEEEPTDSLTLGRYQDNVRKEALARKGLASALESHKKGRLELDSGGSNRSSSRILFLCFIYL